MCVCVFFTFTDRVSRTNNLYIYIYIQNEVCLQMCLKADFSSCYPSDAVVSLSAVITSPSFLRFEPTGPSKTEPQKKVLRKHFFLFYKLSVFSSNKFDYCFLSLESRP